LFHEVPAAPVHRRGGAGAHAGLHCRHRHGFARGGVMTTTFFLLRHAAHDDVGSYLAGRSPNVVLGPDGRAQALRLAGRMRRETFTAVISSPRERTQETAQAVSVTSGVGPVE